MKTHVSLQTKLHILQNKYLSLAGVSRVFWKLIRGVIILGICFLILYPMLAKISVSIMDKVDLYDITVRWIPKHLTFENFQIAWRFMQYREAGWNSLILSLLVTFLQLISCTLVGYGFARFRFFGREILFGLVLLTLLVPPQVLMVPLYMQFRYFNFFGKTFNLLDSYWPFILQSITALGLKNGLYVYIIRQFFRGMPKELEEAAYIDGSGAFRTFLTIMLPSAVPILVTVGLFSFVWQWTDNFYTGLYFPSFKVLPTTLTGMAYDITQFYSQGGTVVNEMTEALNEGYMAMLYDTAILMVIAPIVLIYIIGQRYFVESIERSGIVG